MPGKTKIKYIQSLGHKKYRDEEDLFIAEGPKIVTELLQAVPHYIQEIYAVKEWLKKNEHPEKEIAFIEVTEDELGKLSQLKTPHQVIAILKKFGRVDHIELKNKIVLVLDEIQDPGNFGTMVRIADWFGLDQIVCSADCADIYNPKTVQATMGSIARVRVFYTDLVYWLQQQKDVRVYAGALEGKDVTSMSKIGEGLIVIGNESKGISREVMELVNVKITIPGKGKAESLNAAVAAGIILSHLAG